jgi:Protein of unknown function (DUF3040)
MLNQDDRRRLNAIDQHLTASDPHLAHLLTHWPAPPRERWVKVAAVLTTLVGTVGILVGLIAFSPVLVLLFGSVTLTGWILLLRRRPRSEAGGG